MKSNWHALADFRATLSRFGILPEWNIDDLHDLVMWTKRLKGLNE